MPTKKRDEIDDGIEAMFARCAERHAEFVASGQQVNRDHRTLNRLASAQLSKQRHAAITGDFSGDSIGSDHFEMTLDYLESLARAIILLRAEVEQLKG
jgi:hypothetical protein